MTPAAGDCQGECNIRLWLNVYKNRRCEVVILNTNMCYTGDTAVFLSVDCQGVLCFDWLMLFLQWLMAITSMV